jgi:hypothetical protein
MGRCCPVQDLDSLPFATLGPQLEGHPAFPARDNAEFVQVCRVSHHHCCSAAAVRKLPCAGKLPVTPGHAQPLVLGR